MLASQELATWKLLPTLGNLRACGHCRVDSNWGLPGKQRRQTLIWIVLAPNLDSAAGAAGRYMGVGVPGTHARLQQLRGDLKIRTGPAEHRYWRTCPCRNHPESPRWCPTLQLAEAPVQF